MSASSSKPSTRHPNSKRPSYSSGGAGLRPRRRYDIGSRFPMRHLNARQAQRICERAATSRGLSTEHAQWFAHALVETSLMGIDTHGLRLLPLYLRELDEGRSKPCPVMKVRRR